MTPSCCTAAAGHYSQQCAPNHTKIESMEYILYNAQYYFIYIYIHTYIYIYNEYTIPWIDFYSFILWDLSSKNPSILQLLVKNTK